MVAVAVSLSAVSNHGLPTRSPIIDRLSDTQKARVAEAMHLRTTLGDTIWPGWAVE